MAMHRQDDSARGASGARWVRGITRRAFVQRSAAISALPLVTPVFASRGKPPGEALRVGLVGCGGRGTGAAVQSLRADPYTVLWSMGDAFEPRIETCLGNVEGAAGEEHGERIRVPDERRFAGLDAYQRVIDSGVDVVLLCTPPAFRPPHLAAAVEAGKHVFCEKPVAVDSPGVRSVLQSARIARDMGLALMSGFCWRYSTRERETYQRLHDGAIGDIHTVYTTYNTTGWVRPVPREPDWSDMRFQLRNWQYFTWLSGDHIVEQAVHSIDKIMWAMQDRPPVRCTAVGGRQVRPDVPETGNVYDHFSVTYEYDNGARAFHMCRHWPNTPSDNSDYILGSRGRCTVNGWTDTHVIEGEQPWRCESPRNDMYQQEHDDLFASIRNDRPINDGVAMAHSTLAAIMARNAAYTGGVVTWAQAMSDDLSIVPEPLGWGDLDEPVVPTPGTPLRLWRPRPMRSSARLIRQGGDA